MAVSEVEQQLGQPEATVDRLRRHHGQFAMDVAVCGNVAAAGFTGETAAAETETDAA